MLTASNEPKPIGIGPRSDDDRRHDEGRKSDSERHVQAEREQAQLHRQPVEQEYGGVQRCDLTDQMQVAHQLRRRLADHLEQLANRLDPAQPSRNRLGALALQPKRERGHRADSPREALISATTTQLI